MKVKELKKLLENYPDDHDVIMSCDSEGNSYSPLADIFSAEYVPDSTYSGELAYEDESDINYNSIVLCPTN